jgi:hypothetical protein
MTLDVLLGMDVMDYVRVTNDNSEVLDDLYRAIHDTSVSPGHACSESNIDVRFALVLSYKYGGEDAIGIGDSNPCIQLSSRKVAIQASREQLLSFIERNFPFTHVDKRIR